MQELELEREQELELELKQARVSEYEREVVWEGIP